MTNLLPWAKYSAIVQHATSDLNGLETLFERQRTCPEIFGLAISSSLVRESAPARPERQRLGALPRSGCGSAHAGKRRLRAESLHLTNEWITLRAAQILRAAHLVSLEKADALAGASQAVA